MPYEVKQVKGGFLVCDQKRCFSKHPLTKKKARKQQIALAISTSKKEKQPIGNFFA
jgi:hypothetical protein